MTTEQLIAEITSGGFAQYDESGLIDKTSLKTWIYDELKRFGGNLTTRIEKVLRVRDNKVELPMNFWQLAAAFHCTPDGYFIHDKKDRKILQNQLLFRERVEGIAEWQNGAEFEDYKLGTQKFVREEYFIVRDGGREPWNAATFYYSKPVLLTLMKGFKKDLCSKDSLYFRHALGFNSPYQIQIRGRTMTTNFKEGTVYMHYDGLLEDENGDVEIPETQHNRLKEYLIYYCRKRILEDLIVGDDDSNKINLLNYYAAETRNTFGLAMTEVKMEALGQDWKRRVRNRMRAQTLKYNVMLPRV